MSQRIPVLISAKTFTVHAIQEHFAIVVAGNAFGLMYFIDSLYVQTSNDLIQPAALPILLVLLSRPASVTLSFADRSLRLTFAVVCARERRPLLLLLCIPVKNLLG